MASRSAGSGASGDVFTLNEDGTVTIGWDGQAPVSLRRPKVGEWLSFMEESEAADVWADGVQGEDGVAPVQPTVREAVVSGPYRPLYQRMLAELGDTKVDLADLPLWLSLGNPFARISAWWVANPLSQQAQVATTRLLSP